MPASLAVTLLSPHHVQEILASGVVLEQDHRGVKVVELPDGSLFKIFRPRRVLGHELLRMSARRFQHHADQLLQRRIPAPRVTQVYRIADGHDSAVRYQPVPGTTLRHALQRHQVDPVRMHQLGAFFATLHDRGIYFRSIHPGNIVLMDGDRFGLIDVLDLRLRARALSVWGRSRNWRHFLRCREDRPYLTRERLEAFLQGYGDHAHGVDRALEQFREQARRLYAS